MDIWILLFISILAANLPWMSERFLLIISMGEKGKSIWLRLLEWLILYFIVGGMSFGLETRVTGGIHAQNWGFYVVTSCLFLVSLFMSQFCIREMKIS